MDAPTDYHVLETFSTSYEKYAQDITACSNSQSFIKLYRDGLATIGTIPPHLLETITYLATQMNAQRQGYLSSWKLAKDLGISRETAISRLVELTRLQVGGSAAATYTKVRRGWNKPVYYIYTLGSDLPFAWDCSKTERPFTKLYIEQARELIRHLEPELWATLLVMGLQMSSDRLCRVSLERLSRQMNIAVSSVSDRLKRLLDAGWIERVATPGNQVAVYRLSMSVPVGFGAEDTWVDELDELVCVEELLDDTDRAVSGSPPPLNKMLRVKELTTEQAGETTTKRVVVKTPQKGKLTPKRPSRRRHVGGGVVGDEEKDSQSCEAGSKNESCQVQDPSAPENDELDKAEIKELKRLCGRSNVQRWLSTVGVTRLMEVYQASGSARRSRGGWIRKAIEENWMLEGSVRQQSSTNRHYSPEQPPETGAQFYKMDHRASTLRAAELAGIDLNEDDLALPKTLTPGLIGELRASMR